MIQTSPTPLAMQRFFRILVLTAALFVAASSTGLSAKKPQKRDISKVKQEQQTTRKEIKETSRKLTVNNRETQKQLSRLSTLSGEIAATDHEIDRMQGDVDSINSHIAIVNDSISHLSARMDSLKTGYMRQLRKVQSSRGAMNTLTYVFSSESFTKAWQRVRYLRQFGKWRRRRAEELKLMKDSLTDRRMRLDTLQHERRTALAHLSLAQKQLRTKLDETDRIVMSLKSEGASLKALLTEKERKSKALDSELDKLIAEEQRREEQRRKEEQRKAEARRKAESQRKAESAQGSAAGKTAASTASAPKQEAPVATADADRALTGSFETNKGRLLFPVAGKYRLVRGFGRQKHPELKHVETDNSGIDVEAVGGGKARAVFEGRVSEIFKQPGYNTIVMVRHGNFLSIYANLSDISVKKGDTVKAGQTIGTIYPDPEEDGRSILHFELRKERTKLNPLQWVK